MSESYEHLLAAARERTAYVCLDLQPPLDAPTRKCIATRFEPAPGDEGAMRPQGQGASLAVTPEQVPMQGPTLPGAIPPAVQVNVSTTGTNTLLPPRVADAAPVVALPTMSVPDAKAADALSGVPGLLGRLAGTIPIPALAPVQLSVMWTIEKADTTPASPDTYAQASISALETMQRRLLTRRPHRRMLGPQQDAATACAQPERSAAP